MIRVLTSADIDTVIDIWLTASIESHHFVEKEYWHSQVNIMRDVYIPNSATYVFVLNFKVVGFYSLLENMLAAIFIAPAFQGQKIGTQLIEHAKQQSDALTLNVYKENNASYQFYLSQGLTLVSEQVCEHTGHPTYSMVSVTH
ncbi:N-acetyltransferase [Shewanella olleyana]|uniref:N-acetyltransferase n=1 Tax=Shewanella olleyana TaxID=135626 RepID=UPI00200C61F1|nr:N-acetyltransferase [Shewanella olleyana]MCL1068559.1 N-acetyltransferase [Shewanella olleyana]